MEIRIEEPAPEENGTEPSLIPGDMADRACQILDRGFPIGEVELAIASLIQVLPGKLRKDFEEVFSEALENRMNTLDFADRPSITVELGVGESRSFLEIPEVAVGEERVVVVVEDKKGNVDERG